MSTIQIKVEELNALLPTKIVESEKVEQKFISMYDDIWGSDQGEQTYNREKFYFNKLLTEKPELQECTKLSLFGCFLDMAVNGLSLDQSGHPQCYIIPANIKVKAATGEYWEKRAQVAVTAYGEVYMRMHAGQIKYADNPVVVYEGDLFEASIDENGSKRIKYTAKFPRTSNKPVAAFIRIIRSDDTQDYRWMMESDWVRLSSYSAKKNRGEANALYTSCNGYIDPGFLENKVMKHAFSAYPKVRVGNNTIIQSQEEETIDYGVVVDDGQAAEPITPFGEAKQLVEPTPVSVPISDEDEDAGF